MSCSTYPAVSDNRTVSTLQLRWVTPCLSTASSFPRFYIKRAVNA